MRILLLADSIEVCNGAAKHILLLSKYLQKRGHTVLLLTGSKENIPLAFELQIIECRFLSHRKRSFLNFIRGIFFINKTIRHFKPDIIHAHHFYCANQAKIVTNKRNQILTLHGIIPKVGYLAHLVGINIIAGTFSIKKYIIEISNNYSSLNLASIPFAASFDNIFLSSEKKPNKKLSIINNPNEILIGFIGRLVDEKGINIFLDSLTKLNTKLKIKVLIVGEGKLSSAIPKKINRIKVTHIKTVTAIKPIYNLIDILVIPSLGMEGLPLVLLEAGLLKKCVIASNVDGLSDVIIHNQNGILIPPGNSDELTKWINELIISKSKRIQLGNNLYKTVRQNNNLKKMIDQTEQLYFKLSRNG